jgi:hypothetical protein
MKSELASVVTTAVVVLAGLGISVGSIAILQSKRLAPGPKVPVAAQGGALTVGRLGEMLTQYSPYTTTENGRIAYSIIVARDKWNVNLIISISANGEVIWITNRLTQVPYAGKVSSAALLNVLRKNRDIGPMFFEIWDDSLVMSYPVPNRDLTAESLKKIVDDFVTTVVNNASLWDPATLEGK